MTPQKRLMKSFKLNVRAKNTQILQSAWTNLKIGKHFLFRSNFKFLIKDIFG